MDVTLSGRWFVETMDGHRVEMGPGEISFAEDQGTKADALILVQLEQTPTVGQACQFK